MNNFLLWFFAIPIAIIILSAIFETILHSPIKIAGITFSILLIVTFVIEDETLLVFTILYTLLAFIVAWITSRWCVNQPCSNDYNTQRDTTIESLIQKSTLNNNNILAEPITEYNRRYRRR